MIQIRTEYVNPDRHVGTIITAVVIKVQFKMWIYIVLYVNTLFPK